MVNSDNVPVENRSACHSRDIPDDVPALDRRLIRKYKPQR